MGTTVVATEPLCAPRGTPPAEGMPPEPCTGWEEASAQPACTTPAPPARQRCPDYAPYYRRVQMPIPALTRCLITTEPGEALYDYVSMPGDIWT